MRGIAFLVVAFGLLATACTSTFIGEPVESYVQASDGALLHYRKLGTGPVVLIVPGESAVALDMARLARSRTVIFYDLRGRGRSSASLAIRFDQDVEDLETVREWFGLERFSLLATDFRGAVAAHYAARHPERVDELVLVSPIPISKFPYWNVYTRIFNDRRDDEAFRELGLLKRQGLHRRDPGAWAEAYKLALFRPWVARASTLASMKSSPFQEPNLDPEDSLRKYLGYLAALGEWDWRSVAGSVACRTLVIRGAADPMPAQVSVEWAESIPQARTEVVEGSVRMPWIEEPRQFFGAVDGFLAR